MAAILCSRTAVACAASVAGAPARAQPAGKAFFSGRALKAVAANGKGHRQVTKAKVEFDQVGGAYAKALFTLAQEKDMLEAVHADIDGLTSLFKDNAAVKDFLFDPTTPDQKKKDLVSSVASEAGLTEWTANMLNLLVQQGRIEAVDEIFTAFEEQYCKLTDTQVATLRSAVKLEQEQQFLIAKKLQELTGCKNIKLKPVIDESLIAGFVVEYGSQQMDLSVKGQLNKLATQLNYATSA